MKRKTKTTVVNKNYITSVKNIINKKKKTLILRQAKSVVLYCTACTRTFTVIKKIEGVLAEQQVCPHIILRKVNMS